MAAAIVAISSVQQYTLDHLRVSLFESYPLKYIKKLSYSMYDSDGNDVTNKLKSLEESNDWEFIDSTDVFDIYLKYN